VEDEKARKYYLGEQTSQFLLQDLGLKDDAPADDEQDDPDAPDKDAL